MVCPGMARKRILTDQQAADMREFMGLGFTSNEARYRVLDAAQRQYQAKQVQAAERRRQRENPRAELLKQWRISHRHSKPDLPFTITEADLDWPTHCPVTGVELHYGGRGGNDDTGGRRGHRPNSAALDRIDNSKGCVPGNVVIVSSWVNIRKGDATSEQLRQIAAFYSQWG